MIIYVHKNIIENITPNVLYLTIQQQSFDANWVAKY